MPGPASRPEGSETPPTATDATATPGFGLALLLALAAPPAPSPTTAAPGGGKLGGGDSVATGHSDVAPAGEPPFAGDADPALRVTGKTFVASPGASDPGAGSITLGGVPAMPHAHSEPGVGREIEARANLPGASPASNDRLVDPPTPGVGQAMVGEPVTGVAADVNDEPQDGDAKRSPPTQEHPVLPASPPAMVWARGSASLVSQTFEPPADGPREPATQPTPRAGGAAGTGDRITIEIGAEHGLEGRLRLALRGNSLHATLLSPDRTSLERLDRDLGELRHALAERGFTDARVTLREAGATVDSERPRESREEDGGRDRPRDQSARREQEDSSTHERPRRGSRTVTGRKAGRS